MVPIMKDSLLMDLNMVKEGLNLLMEISMKEVFVRITRKVMGCMSLPMEFGTRACG